MQRDVKFEIMLLKHNRDFSKSIIKHYTSLEHLMSGRDVSLCANLQVVAKRQFIGLKDANGVEIYDGDILQTNDGLYKVKYSEPSYLLISSGGNCYNSGDHYVGEFPDTFEWCSFEIIGNIYENPELL